MLNLALGSPRDRAGRGWIETAPGASGHALYGPYVRCAAGNYHVVFSLALPYGGDASADAVCALADVVTDGGRTVIASAFVFVADARDGSFVLPLHLDHDAELEFRLHVNGAIALLIADDPALKEGRAPVASRPEPALLTERQALFRNFHERGATIDRDGDRLVLSLAGVRFGAKKYDDVNFVDELFFKSAYNFKTNHRTCVIDVGMNVGLASLLFAAKAQVEEVHAFEPFVSTYERGLANIALNPELAGKIRTNNFGLADADEDATLLIHDTHGDSGGMQTRSVDGGTPTQLKLRDASATLRPIIADARGRGLDVVAKIDCEGAEFPIFKSLAASGLLGDISALMVEWHRIFEGRTQDELIAPLLDAGFTVFDVTPPDGNGFFYAVKRDGSPDQR